jgi:hypothetical protein
MAMLTKCIYDLDGRISNSIIITSKKQNGLFITFISMGSGIEMQCPYSVISTKYLIVEQLIRPSKS